MRSISGASYETLASYVYDPSYPAHRPKTITDGAEKTTQFTYNASSPEKRK